MYKFKRICWEVLQEGVTSLEVVVYIKVQYSIQNFNYYYYEKFQLNSVI